MTPSSKDRFFTFINIAILLAVVTQAYTVNLMEESVLRGNAAILKCHISTFVTEYVSVSSWIISEADTDVLEIKAESNDLGIFNLKDFDYPILFPYTIAILSGISIFSSCFSSLYC